jgi:hypothetical protein
MKRILHLIVIQSSVIFLLISCSNNNRFSLNPRLPFIKYSEKLTSDSSIFTIEMKNDSMLISDNISYRLIKDAIEIEDYLCAEIKNKNINLHCNYPIILKIDSLTSFSSIDKLIEQLQLLGYHKFYFKTRNAGFSVYFQEKDEVLQSEVGALYGERFAVSNRYFLYGCSIKPGTKLKVVDEPPPPPPPPSIVYDLITIDSANPHQFCIIELKDGEFYINRKKYSLDSFKKNIYYESYFIVKLGKGYNYSDLIRLFDMILETKSKKHNEMSLLKFKRKFSELNDEQAREISRSCNICYTILSLAEQQFIELSQPKATISINKKNQPLPSVYGTENNLPYNLYMKIVTDSLLSGMPQYYKPKFDDNGKKYMIIKGHFTSKSKNEYILQRNFSHNIKDNFQAACLFSFDKNVWKFERFLKHDSIIYVDVDKDSINEIESRDHSYGEGCEYFRYAIISLKNNVPKVVFKRFSYEHEPSMGGYDTTLGSHLSDVFEYKLLTVAVDKPLQLQESRKTGKLIGWSADHYKPVIKYSTISKIYHLVNGRYHADYKEPDRMPDNLFNKW